MASRKAAAAEGGFASLELDARLLETLTSLGYEEPTPIQREAIPLLLEGRDLVGQAATGTGKTAAFALPLLQKLAADGERGKPAALVLVPTRELAMQVSEAIHKYGRSLGTTVLPVYGGQAYGQQMRALKRGVDIVVATPGRALDHLGRGTLSLASVSIVVLDEADEMLDMGFAEDIEAILAETPSERQTVLFSATMPPRIAGIAKRHLMAPVEIKIAREPMKAGEVPKVRQTAYIVPRVYKPATLGRVLDLENPESAIVFCRTRTEVDELTETMNSRGYRAEALHGGMSQEQRDRVMKKFRKGAADLLIATDVAARGLDIEHLTHVINYHVPPEPESYVHRIGRVGRAGREGVAVTIAEPREHRLLRNIGQTTKQKIEVAQVPTVADVRARRLDLTRATLRETLLGADLDHFRVVVESLAGEFDIMDVAAAAVKMAHQSSDQEGEDEQEIPTIAPRPEFGDRNGQRGPPTARGPRGRPARGRGPARGFARLYVNAGREAGVRPQDLVGAIAGEAGIAGREIGAIDIADRFSLVEVPEEAVDRIISALKTARIKGRRVAVRRDARS